MAAVFGAGAQALAVEWAAGAASVSTPRRVHSGAE